MPITYNRDNIPELIRLPPKQNEEVWCAAIRRRRRVPAYWLVNAGILAANIPFVLLIDRLIMTDTLLATAVTITGILVTVGVKIRIETAILRREIRRILAEEGEAARSATPPEC